MDETNTTNRHPERLDMTSEFDAPRTHHVIPGAGWIATLDNGDGTEFHVPVVAWHITTTERPDPDDGPFMYGTPLIASVDGEVCENSTRQAAVFWHPDGSPLNVPAWVFNTLESQRRERKQRPT